MNRFSPLRFAPLLALLLATGAFAGLAFAGDSPLAGTSQAWEAALDRGDAAAVGAMYAEDADVLAPNMPRVSGRKAITELMAGMIAQGLKIKISIGSETIDGALGVKSGDYVLTDKDGKEVDRGKWIEVWQRRNDKWELVEDMWNTDLPAPASAPAEAAAPAAG
ncbi:MAG: nuclear transport factor 2 family protein [Arenimonas sp.]